MYLRRPSYCIFSQIWMCFTLYAMHPTFMKSTPCLAQHSYFCASLYSYLWYSSQYQQPCYTMQQKRKREKLSFIAVTCRKYQSIYIHIVNGKILFSKMSFFPRKRLVKTSFKNAVKPGFVTRLVKHCKVLK
jgi:hypothetical protein